MESEIKDNTLTYILSMLLTRGDIQNYFLEPHNVVVSIPKYLTFICL